MDLDIDNDKTIREVELDEAQEFALSKDALFNEVSSIKRKNIELVLKMLKTRVGRKISEKKDLHMILENTDYMEDEESII